MQTSKSLGPSGLAFGFWLTLALLFPLALVASELTLRYTHHRPLGAVLMGAVTALLALALRELVRTTEPSGSEVLEVESQIEIEDGPAVSGVVTKRGWTGHMAVLTGLALLLWPLALGWVFLG